MLDQAVTHAKDQPCAAQQGAYRCLFVGGLPRSGTHVLSALISTSGQVSPFAPEAHYFHTAVDSLMFGFNHYEASQSHFVRSKDWMVKHHVQFLRGLLDEAWECLGRPRQLVVKHCSLTPFFAVLADYFPEACFLVTRRDARDVLASELRVHRRDMGDEAAPLPDVLRHAVAARYNNTFQRLIAESATALKGRLLSVRYERLVHGDLCGLPEFLDVDDIEPARLWTRAVFDIGDFRRGRTWSPSWGSPMRSDTVGSYAQILTQEQSDWIHRATWTTALAAGVLEHPIR